MATTGATASNITEQFVREAPDIEAYKLGLMQSAQALKPPTLPDYQVAGMAPQQGRYTARSSGYRRIYPLHAGCWPDFEPRYWNA